MSASGAKKVLGTQADIITGGLSEQVLPDSYSPAAKKAASTDLNTPDVPITANAGNLDPTITQSARAGSVTMSGNDAGSTLLGKRRAASRSLGYT